MAEISTGVAAHQAVQAKMNSLDAEGLAYWFVRDGPDDYPDLKLPLIVDGDPSALSVVLHPDGTYSVRAGGD